MDKHSSSHTHDKTHLNFNQSKLPTQRGPQGHNATQNQSLGPLYFPPADKEHEETVNSYRAKYRDLRTFPNNPQYSQPLQNNPNTSHSTYTRTYSMMPMNPISHQLATPHGQLGHKNNNYGGKQLKKEHDHLHDVNDFNDHHYLDQITEQTEQTSQNSFHSQRSPHSQTSLGSKGSKASGGSKGSSRSASGSVTSPSHSVTPPFVSKLSNMLKNSHFHDFISWNEEGTSVLIKKVNEFSAFVLPKYFKHKNFTSFLRQLNMYGFSTARQGPNWREFKNELFNRNKPDLFCKIKRRNAGTGIHQVPPLNVEGSSSLHGNQNVEGLRTSQNSQNLQNVQNVANTGSLSQSQRGNFVQKEEQPAKIEARVAAETQAAELHRKRKKDEFKGKPAAAAMQDKSIAHSHTSSIASNASNANNNALNIRAKDSSSSGTTSAVAKLQRELYAAENQIRSLEDKCENQVQRIDYLEDRVTNLENKLNQLIDELNNSSNLNQTEGNEGDENDDNVHHEDDEENIDEDNADVNDDGNEDQNEDQMEEQNEDDGVDFNLDDVVNDVVQEEMAAIPEEATQESDNINHKKLNQEENVSSPFEFDSRTSKYSKSTTTELSAEHGSPAKAKPKIIPKPGNEKANTASTQDRKGGSKLGEKPKKRRGSKYKFNTVVLNKLGTRNIKPQRRGLNLNLKPLGLASRYISKSRVPRLAVAALTNRWEPVGVTEYRGRNLSNSLSKYNSLNSFEVARVLESASLPDDQTQDFNFHDYFFDNDESNIDGFNIPAQERGSDDLDARPQRAISILSDMEFSVNNFSFLNGESNDVSLGEIPRPNTLAAEEFASPARGNNSAKQSKANREPSGKQLHDLSLLKSMTNKSGNAIVQNVVEPAKATRKSERRLAKKAAGDGAGVNTEDSKEHMQERLVKSSTPSTSVKSNVLANARCNLIEIKDERSTSTNNTGSQVLVSSSSSPSTEVEHKRTRKYRKVKDEEVEEKVGKTNEERPVPLNKVATAR